LMSMEIYHDDSYFNEFDLTKHFEKWAVVEVSAFESIPVGMHAFELPGGLYAQFMHHGPAADFAKTFGHIFTVWLPDSGYRIDNSRPHFEVMGAPKKRYGYRSSCSQCEIRFKLYLRKVLVDMDSFFL
jgi:AraC family transcriptional regulator